ncbi:peptidase M28 domain-containing protein [Heterostelium album PN500]|uniref:Carboxypeptidase Q n=1 Tax=Heterostelium pallidum (strain ATCC 26659 / Pp 5 / PN500) TaxID=670386 RepID=D3BH76_HETP5|nr:peptidase M28 domain-containing protein [Heterostelium album PN500]EFA79460.1 peptidase M28 domain-containing protein [Heterostelium album PN500]|eukprot:XP_020431581.1 peptidase M28 domain-containing protein [Heterostelium album PN500]
MDQYKYTPIADNENDRHGGDILLPSSVSNSNNKSSSFTIFRDCGSKLKKNRNILIVIGLILFVILAAIVIPVVILHYKKPDVLSDNCSADSSQLISATTKGTLAFAKLTEMCTRFGNRLSGSDALENAIDWVKQKMIDDGLDNVQTEDVMVTHWVRGNEHASIQSPYYKKMNILGLGGSINTTSSDGITAPVMVVSSFDDLKARCAAAAGNIVLFNVPFTNYSSTVRYRSGGAVAAAQCNAVAALVRSITPYSLGTPHTGMMSYQSGVTQIPTAAITLEDADLIQGLVNFNQTVTINLYMEAQTMPDKAKSRNVFGEVTGSENPEQVVVIGGHIDSWDVGQGAIDDGCGVMIAWEAVRLIKVLGLQPKRTIRVVAWTNEENGAAGGAAYAQAHLNETFFSIETDNGPTTPLGFTVDGASPETIKALQQLADDSLMTLGANSVSAGESGTDNSFLVVDGKIPGANLVVNTTQYFWFHHSEGDALDKVNPTEMDQCVAAIASMALSKKEKYITHSIIINGFKNRVKSTSIFFETVGGTSKKRNKHCVCVDKIKKKIHPSGSFLKMKFIYLILFCFISIFTSSSLAYQWIITHQLNPDGSLESIRMNSFLIDVCYTTGNNNTSFKMTLDNNSNSTYIFSFLYPNANCKDGNLLIREIPLSLENADEFGLYGEISTSPHIPQFKHNVYFEVLPVLSNCTFNSNYTIGRVSMELLNSCNWEISMNRENHLIIVPLLDMYSYDTNPNSCSDYQLTVNYYFNTCQFIESELGIINFRPIHFNVLYEILDWKTINIYSITNSFDQSSIYDIGYLNNTLCRNTQNCILNIQYESSISKNVSIWVQLVNTVNSSYRWNIELNIEVPILKNIQIQPRTSSYDFSIEISGPLNSYDLIVNTTHKYYISSTTFSIQNFYSGNIIGLSASTLAIYVKINETIIQLYNSEPLFLLDPIFSIYNNFSSYVENIKYYVVFHVFGREYSPLPNDSKVYISINNSNLVELYDSNTQMIIPLHNNTLYYISFWASYDGFNSTKLYFQPISFSSDFEPPALLVFSGPNFARVSFDSIPSYLGDRHYSIILNGYPYVVPRDGDTFPNVALQNLNDSVVHNITVLARYNEETKKSTSLFRIYSLLKKPIIKKIYDQDLVYIYLSGEGGDSQSYRFSVGEEDYFLRYRTTIFYNKGKTNEPIIFTISDKFGTRRSILEMIDYYPCKIKFLNINNLSNPENLQCNFKHLIPNYSYYIRVTCMNYLFVPVHQVSTFQTLENEIKGCSSNCSNNGECIKGECHCKRGFSGLTCQSLNNEPIIYTNPNQPSMNMSTTGISHFSLNFDEIREVSQENSIVSSFFISNLDWIRETKSYEIINPIDNSIVQYNEWNYKLKSKILQLDSFEIKFSQYVRSNSSTSTIDYIIVDFIKPIQIKYGNIKYQLKIENWNFKSRLNTLEIVSIPQFELNECLESNYNILDTGDFVTILIENSQSEIYGKLNKFGYLDSIPRTINHFFYTNSNNSSVKLITSIPYFEKNMILDPDFSLLLHPNPDKNNCNSERKNIIKWKIIVGTVFGSVFFASAVYATTFMIKRNQRIVSERVRLESKLKNFNKN